MHACALVRSALVIACSALLPTQIAEAQNRDSVLLAIASSVPLTDLDSEYPDTPFGEWFVDVVGTYEVLWEVNDCGEGGDGRSSPLCADASARLRSGVTVVVSLLVASRDGETDSRPLVWMMYVITPERLEHLPDLDSLAAYVRNQRDP